MGKKHSPVEKENNPLLNKTLYAFGTSITYGHAAGIGYVDYIAQDNKMQLQKMAVNGATVRVDEDNHILAQIEKAPVEIPDFVLFDGLANDAYPEVTENPAVLGKISDDFDSEFDVKTYCGAFETICRALLTKYRGAKIIYVATHKTPARTYAAQEVLQNLNLQMCGKWSLSVVDLYHEGGLNGFIKAYQDAYSYDKVDENGGNSSTSGSGTHPNEAGYRKFYVPDIVSKMLSLVSE